MNEAKKPKLSETTKAVLSILGMVAFFAIWIPSVNWLFPRYIEPLLDHVAVFLAPALIPLHFIFPAVFISTTGWNSLVAILLYIFTASVRHERISTAFGRVALTIGWLYGLSILYIAGLYTFRPPQPVPWHFPLRAFVFSIPVLFVAFAFSRPPVEAPLNPNDRNA